MTARSISLPRRRSLGRGAAAILIAAALAAPAATPAAAHHKHGHWKGGPRHGQPPVVYVQPQPVIVAPAPVAIVQPAPVVVAPQPVYTRPSIDIVFPIHIE